MAAFIVGVDPPLPPAIEDVGTGTPIPEEFPTQVYPLCKEAEKDPLTLKDPDIVTLGVLSMSNMILLPEATINKSPEGPISDTSNIPPLLPDIVNMLDPLPITFSTLEDPEISTSLKLPVSV